LRRAQQLTVFREEVKNLGIRRFAFVRRVLLVLGQRLHEQGSLSCREDIFFLEVSELEPVATGGASFDWRGRIELRRREYERNLKLSPPQIVNGRFDPDAGRRPVANADAKLLEGIAVSPGRVTGPARVICGRMITNRFSPAKFSSPRSPIRRGRRISSPPPAWSWNKAGFFRTAASARGNTVCRR
jgi:hypothetical protein